MGSMQNYELRNEKIKRAFEALKAERPDRLKQRLRLSWSNWGFGMETLEASLARLRGAGIDYIELHGNHYGPDLGYRAADTRRLLESYGIRAGGICGMFSRENDLSSSSAIHRQAALDYLKREIDFAAEIGAGYLLVVPAAVGRPQKYDDQEAARSAQTLRLVADRCVSYGVRAAIEPVRAAETSIVHTIEEAIAYLELVDHPGIAHINADVYHMQAEETHIGEALLAAGDRLANVHLADSNRRALGEGSLDIDTVIRALYVLGFNEEGKYVTPEPLGPGGDPYPAMHGNPDPALLDRMVSQTASYFREREEALLA